MPFSLAPAEPQRSKALPIDMDYVVDVMLRLLAVPSPSGRTDHIMQLIGEEIAALGMPFELTRRGVLRGELAGEGGPETPDRAVIVHADTIGCMVKRLKENGRLELVPIGTHSARFAEGVRVTIFVDDLEQTFSGTVLPLKASGHRWGDEVDTQPPGWEHVEVRVDENVVDAGGLESLGIGVGDFVAFDARPAITPSGYVKSRHLDDKAGIAADVAEMISIDISVVAPGQASTEHTVNIAAQDSSGPFDYHLVRRLAGLCRHHGIDHRRDVYGYYRSDAASALEAGAETRAALIGFGIDASHGYERTHLDGIRRTAELIAVYLQTDLTFRGWDTAPSGNLKDFPSTIVQPADELGPR